MEWNERMNGMEGMEWNKWNGMDGMEWNKWNGMDNRNWGIKEEWNGITDKATGTGKRPPDCAVRP